VSRSAENPSAAICGFPGGILAEGAGALPRSCASPRRGVRRPREESSAVARARAAGPPAVSKPKAYPSQPLNPTEAALAQLASEGATPDDLDPKACAVLHQRRRNRAMNRAERRRLGAMGKRVHHEPDADRDFFRRFLNRRYRSRRIYEGERAPRMRKPQQASLLCRAARARSTPDATTLATVGTLKLEQ
jgi:hypothetical protein